MGAPAPPSVTLALHGPIAPEDLPGLRDRVCTAMTQSGADVLLCDVRGVEPDAGTVDALCRLQMAARRHRCTVRLLHPSEELLELVAFMGLTDVLTG